MFIDCKKSTSILMIYLDLRYCWCKIKEIDLRYHFNRILGLNCYPLVTVTIRHWCNTLDENLRRSQTRFYIGSLALIWCRLTDYLDV